MENETGTTMLPGIWPYHWKKIFDPIILEKERGPNIKTMAHRTDGHNSPWENPIYH